MNEVIQEKIDYIYHKLGCVNEHPLHVIFPAGGNLLDIDDEKYMKVLTEELELLEQIANNPKISILVRDCDNLLEEIANRSSLEETISEVNTRYDDLAIDSDRSFLGLMLYHHLASLDSVSITGNQAKLPFPKTLNSGAVSHNWLAGASQVSSVILRMYLILTFFQGDMVKNALNSLTLESNSYLDLYRKLFSHEYVRHARNAFAHGHVRQVFAGVYIVDRSFSALLTPGMMEKLSIWIWMFYYDLFLVSINRRKN